MMPVTGWVIPGIIRSDSGFRWGEEHMMQGGSALWRP